MGFELNLHAELPWEGETTPELLAKQDEIRDKLAELIDVLLPKQSEDARFELDLPEKDAQERQVSVRAVLRWLEANASWLLIFDNADTPKDLQGRLPAPATSHHYAARSDRRCLSARGDPPGSNSSAPSARH